MYKESSKLRLRALSLLAEGDLEQRFEAAVLLHEVSRIEERLLQGAEPLLDRETRLRHRVERCGALIDGADPPAAALAWGEILDLVSDLGEGRSRPYLERLQPRFEALATRFRHDWNQAERDPGRLAEAYPGVAGLWWILYQQAAEAGDLPVARGHLLRCRRLDSESPLYRALDLLLLARLGGPEAEEALQQAWEERRALPAEVALFYALAQILLSQGSSAGQRLTRAREILVSQGSRADGQRLGRLCEATRRVVESLERGQQLEVDLLYRSGLGGLALVATREVLVETLIAEAERVIQARPLAA